MAYSVEVLADSPSAYLRLNETTGTQAADSTGNGNVGTYVNSPTLGVSGLIATDPADTAMQTGVNQQLTLPYTFANNTFTLELWWKWTAAATADGIFRDNTSSSLSGYFISVSPTGVTTRIAGTNRTNTSVNYQDGIRHHFVLTYDGSTATLYIDGSQIDQWTKTSSVLPATPLHIGYNGTNANQYMPGVYDEVALYNSVLTSARVGVHYTKAGANPSDARVESLYLEALASGSGSAQIEANYVETMATGTANAQVETSYVETLATGLKNAQVEANYVEAMTLVLPAQVETVYAETMLTGTPPTQIEAVYTESLLTTAPPVNIATVYTEVLLLAVPSAGFTGWGSPI